MLMLIGQKRWIRNQFVILCNILINMQIKLHKYTQDFYKMCNDYINNGHSLKETSIKFNINYCTLRQNLIKFNYRKPSRIGKKKKQISFDENYFDHIDTFNKAYFLGLLLSDGYVCKTAYGKKVGIALQLNDQYILEEFKKDINLKTNIYTYKNSCKIVLSGSNHIVEKLEEYGIIENKSRCEYAVPNIPSNYLSSFIRGYFDGDGCITIKSTGYSCVSICSNSNLFINSLKETLLSISNNFINIRVRTEQGNRKNPLYVLYITRINDQNIFKDIIYSDDGCRLIRKYDKFKKIPC